MLLYAGDDYDAANQALLGHIEFLDRLSSESGNTVRSPYAVDAVTWFVRLAKLEQRANGRFPRSTCAKPGAVEILAMAGMLSGKAARRSGPNGLRPLWSKESSELNPKVGELIRNASRGTHASSVAPVLDIRGLLDLLS